jgi:uracil-DNA glycosylase
VKGLRRHIRIALKRSISHFLRLLKASPTDGVFNPWWQTDLDNDVGREAPLIRRRQLRAYLKERLDEARIALIGEALGYRGGHFSGIAMTSERLLLGGCHVLSTIEPRRTSRPERWPRGFSEPTASIVWNTLLELGLSPRAFVLWNAFPWRSFDPTRGLLSNRTPTRAELVAGAPVLKAFRELFPATRLIAVGRLASAQLEGIESVRHPASGGAALFRRQVYALVRGS